MIPDIVNQETSVVDDKCETEDMYVTYKWSGITQSGSANQITLKMKSK